MAGDDAGAGADRALDVGQEDRARGVGPNLGEGTRPLAVRRIF